MLSVLEREWNFEQNMLKNFHHIFNVLINCPEKFFTFQQDSALTHGTRDTVWFLEQATPQFISPDQRCGLHYLWHHPIACLPVLCVQTSMDWSSSWRTFIWHGTEYHEQCNSTTVCKLICNEMLSKCCNDYLNRHYRLCETLIGLDYILHNLCHF